jgi:PAS domain S-box-containing protein
MCITAFAVGLRVLLEPLWGHDAPFVVLYPAVMLSAYLGGTGPGLLSTVVATLAAGYFWFEPYRAVRLVAAADAALLAAFTVVCAFMVLLTQALTRERARLDALLDASPVGLGFHDGSLRYIGVNRALAEVNGRPALDHIGRKGREILGDAAADVVEPILKDVLRTGRAVHVPALRVRLAATGVDRWYSVSYAPVRDAGRVSAVAVSVSDITETQQAQEALAHERELLQTLVDSIPVMITMYEPGTRLLRLNREFERVTGWTAADATADDFMAACYPDPAYRAAIREYMDTPTPGWRDILMTTKSGRVVETSWSMVRLSDDSRVGIGLDVTDRKRYEAEMRAARAAAETENRSKDEFIAMLGHELRNPLSAISGAVAILQRVGRPDEQPAASARDVIARQTQHLARLMDDLLDVGRVMTGKIVLDRRPLDLLDAARRVETTVRATGRAVRHGLSVAGTPAWIDGDLTRIEQVITNLVTNAIKYTPADGVIGVFVGEAGGDAVVRVSDTGHGISAALLPRIFDLFVQGEQAPERAQGGLGIGLTLVRRLVELHGGRVEAASAGPGTGSTFTVSFPRLPVPPRAAEASTRRTVRPQRTLIVEDNDDAREMLRTLLALDGHTVYEAANGIAGLAAALEHRPDVAVIDIGLPEMDGYEVARKLRASESLKAIKLIALTGYGQADDARRAREAGFDLHVVKPVDPERLAEAVAWVVANGGPGFTAPPSTLA